MAPHIPPISSAESDSPCHPGIQARQPHSAVAKLSGVKTQSFCRGSIDCAFDDPPARGTRNSAERVFDSSRSKRLNDASKVGKERLWSPIQSSRPGALIDRHHHRTAVTRNGHATESSIPIYRANIAVIE